jgi:hypothetical protein
MMYDMKVMDILKGVAKKTKSKVAKELLEDDGTEAAKIAAMQLFHEAMEAFCEGEMSWKEAVDDIHENLKAMKVEAKGEEKEEK